MSLSVLANARRKKAILIFSVFMIAGLSGLVELARREYRSVVLGQLDRSSEAAIQYFAQVHGEALRNGDRNQLERAALDRLRNPEWVSFEIRLHGDSDAITFGDRLVESSFGKAAADETAASGSRIGYRKNRWILETARVMDGTVVSTGRDVTAAISETRRTDDRVRQAQVVLSIFFLIGFWVATRWLLPESEGDNGSTEDASGDGATVDVVPRSIQPKRPIAEIECGKDSPVAGSKRPPVAVDGRALSRAHHILVVEDNPVNQSVAKQMLERLGCRVTCVEDGLASLAAVEEEAFDLVFMDIQMPRMDGLEATRRIRLLESTEGRKPSPIVALTAHSQPSDRMASMQAGMDAHLSKPFSSQDLLDAILDHCESEKEQGA